MLFLIKKQIFFKNYHSLKLDSKYKKKFLAILKKKSLNKT